MIMRLKFNLIKIVGIIEKELNNSFSNNQMIFLYYRDEISVI